MSIEKLNLIIRSMEFENEFKRIHDELITIDLSDFNSVKVFFRGLSFERLKELRLHWKTIDDLKISNFIDFEIGVRNGWWEDWNNKEPIPFPTFADLDVLNSQGIKFMSQLLVRLECFPSVAEAKKSGWNKPIERGEFLIKFDKFKKIRIIVE